MSELRDGDNFNSFIHYYYYMKIMRIMRNYFVKTMIIYKFGVQEGLVRQACKLK